MIQYDEKRVISITNLVGTTCWTRYHIPKEITYGQGSEFIGHEFRTYLINDRYKITDKPSALGNTTTNAILEQIHQVLGNLVQTYNIKDTYVDDYSPWSGILAAATFAKFLNRK